MAILFEEYDGVGAQFVMDLISRSHILGARRALSNSPLVQMLNIRNFPTVALFRRDHQQALYMQRYTNQTVKDIDDAITNDMEQGGRRAPILTTTLAPVTTTTNTPLIDCHSHPERCRDMYYVSETDMLKAMRMALLDEVTRVPGAIRGDNFTNLHEFMTLLSNVRIFLDEDRFRQDRDFFFGFFKRKKSKNDIFLIVFKENPKIEHKIENFRFPNFQKNRNFLIFNY